MDSRHSRIRSLKSFATWISVALVALLLSACQTSGRQFTDAELRAEYDRATETWRANTRGEFEYKVRHIMVRSRAQADDALARVRAGESFGAVANAVSLDTSSNRIGGELGWNLGASFTPNFETAMKALGPQGIVDAPVQTPFGWHIVEVTDRRLPTWPAFEQVKDRLAQALREQKARN